MMQLFCVAHCWLSSTRGGVSGGGGHDQRREKQGALPFYFRVVLVSMKKTNWRQYEKKLQVWWSAQVEMKAFEVDVSSVTEGAKLLRLLANYDIFSTRTT